MLVTLCDVRDSGDNREGCSISEEPQAVYTVRTCSGDAWVCLGPRLWYTLCQLTTQHPSHINSDNLRCHKFPSITVRVCVTVSVFVEGCINWWCFGNTHIILSDKYRMYLPATNPLGVWTICWAGHVSAVNVKKRSGKDRHLMKQYRCAYLLIFGVAAQCWYSAV